jgi:hypothetical protein
MADVRGPDTTTSWAELMREAKGPLQEAMKFKTVLLSEVKRDKSPKRWSGKHVTVPIFTAPHQGAGGMSETSTFNDTINVDVEQARILSGIVGMPIKVSSQLLKQAVGDENVWAEALPSKLERAENAFGRVCNEMMTGFTIGSGGTALLAAVNGNTSASGGATQNVDVGTAANWHQLYVGRVIQVLVRSTGAYPSGATMPTIITARSKSGGTITIKNIDNSATSFATASATEGLYIQGSYDKGIQGIGQIAARTGTFENIAKGDIEIWQGIDGREGSTTVVDPAISVFDTAERLVAEIRGETPDFYLCDPAVVDKYTQGLTVQARWAGEEGKLESGWTGVRYRNKVLMPDFDMKPKTAIGVQLEDYTLYTLDDGPDWDELDGTMFRRFDRSLPVEAWLVWYLQLGAHTCNGTVEVGYLSQS